MIESDEIKVELQGPVAIVRIDRPAKRNAFTQKMLLDLTELAERLRLNSDILSIVVTGTDKFFSAGIDLKDPERWAVDDLSVREQRQVMQRGRNVFGAWEALPQVTVCAIEGYAIGAGLAFAMSCDWRVMANDAFLWLPEVQHGISLGWGALPRLTNLVGPAFAKRLIILCEKVPAELAERHGIVDWVTHSRGSFELAMDYACKVTDLPPGPVMMTKEAVNACATALVPLSTYMEADQANFLRSNLNPNK